MINGYNLGDLKQQKFETTTIEMYLLTVLEVGKLNQGVGKVGSFWRL